MSNGLFGTRGEAELRGEEFPSRSLRNESKVDTEEPAASAVPLIHIRGPFSDLTQCLHGPARTGTTADGETG